MFNCRFTGFLLKAVTITFELTVYFPKYIMFTDIKIFTHVKIYVNIIKIFTDTKI